ncbi:MAG: virulence-associated protein [Lachnospiraceae bacterium]|jgi:predicted P-loop ATPase|nr:virulence-associated protein [Lachnospiraceae bacterium]
MLNDRKVKIAVANSRKATNWITQELLWSAMVQKLSVPERHPETHAEYKSYPKSKQDELKDVGGFVGGELKEGKRRNGHALSRHLVTLDADNIAPGGTQAIINAVDALGCGYAIYSTRKHEGAAPRLRIIFPLDVPCSADEYEPIARKAASFLNLSIFDPTTFEPVRLMYWPSISNDSEYVFVYGDKPFLSKDGMLSLYTDWRNVSEWPELPGAAKIRDRSAKKQGNPLEKQGIVGAFCKIYDVPAAIDKFLIGVYELCEGDRFTYTEGSTVGGAVLYDNGNFLFSHHGTDPASGKLCNAFDLVRLHLFQDQDDEAKPDTPVTNLQSFKSMCEYALGDPEVSKIVSIERYEKAQEEFTDSRFNQDLTTEEKPNMDWLGKLKCSSQTGLPNKTIDNVLIILENDPKLKERFYHDEFGNRAIVASPMPWENGSTKNFKQRAWSDEDDAGLRHYIEKVYTITGKERIYDAVAVYATARKRHKLKEYLESLKWDNVPRVDRLLIDYFGTEDNEYSRMVIRKTLTAAIARVINPGVKFDSMLILSGAQGVGKSTFFSILGREWYSDSLATFEGKDASELIQGYWIVEAGELTGFNKSEMNAVKQFLSKRTDIYRVPYGRRTAEFPRSCIIVGTTNDKEFLKDRTGNRRFWPVDLGVQQSVKNVFKQLPEEVDQIWAEAFMRYRIGEKLYLEGTVAEEAMRQQEEHKESNPKEGIIKAFVTRKVPADWMRRDLSARRIFWGSEFKDEASLVERDRICAAEIWCECFNGDLKLMRRSDAVEINGILSEIVGWERTQGALKFGNFYGAQKGFVKSFQR